MQATEMLTTEAVNELVDAIYQIEQPEILLADSEFGEELEQFMSAAEVKSRIARYINEGKFFCNFAVRYPSSDGRIDRTLVTLKPEYCSGHTFRYSANGWGVIQVQFDFKNKPNVKCRIAVNSEKRASAWETQDPKLASVSAWKWPVVEKHARRLCRKLKSLAQPDVQAGLPKRTYTFTNSIFEIRSFFYFYF